MLLIDSNPRYQMMNNHIFFFSVDQQIYCMIITMEFDEEVLR